MSKYSDEVLQFPFYFEFPSSIILIKDQHIDKAYTALEKSFEQIDQILKLINEKNNGNADFVISNINRISDINTYCSDLVQFIKSNESAYISFATWKNIPFPLNVIEEYERTVSLNNYLCNVIYSNASRICEETKRNE